MKTVKGMGELTEEDLAGFSLTDIKCNACSGYGNCGYRMYRLHEGKPVVICQYTRRRLMNGEFLADIHKGRQ